MNPPNRTGALFAVADALTATAAEVRVTRLKAGKQEEDRRKAVGKVRSNFPGGGWLGWGNLPE